MSKKGNTTREVKYEILRIICMLMVTSLHFWGNSRYLLSPNVNINYIIGWIIETGCLVATNTFIIISSYFLALKESINYKRLLHIYYKVICTSIIVMIGMIICKRKIKLSYISFFFPLISRKWGFVNNYFIYYLCIPIINMYLKNSKKKVLEISIFGAVIAASIIPTFTHQDFIPVRNGDSFIWFLIIFLIVGYIKKYSINITMKNSVLLYIAPIFIQLISRYSIAISSEYLFGEIKYDGVLYLGDISIFTVMASFGLFFIFYNLKDNNCGNMNFIILRFSSASFVVYLIQEHPLLRSYIWNILCPITEKVEIVLLRWIIALASVYFVSFIMNEFFSLMIKSDN